MAGIFPGIEELDIHELTGLGQTSVSANLGLIALVKENITAQRNLLPAISECLSDFKFKMMDIGTSSLTVLILVEAEQTPQAVNKLHDLLFAQSV